MELTDRKLKILQAVIAGYVKTAEPVGSRTLSKQFNKKISAATIRNEMNDLEEMGYLTHPHTSAGRVPSDKAYRLYVNNMMGRVELPDEEKQMIRHTLLADIDEFDKTMQHAANLLSEITNMASFALSPARVEERVQYVHLNPVDERSVVLMIIAESGKSTTTLLRLSVPYTEETLRVLSKSLTYDYKGRKITDVLRNHIIEDFETDINAMGMLAKNIMPNFLKTLEDLLNVNLYMDGLSNIFDIPEFADLNRAKNFVSLFERDNEEDLVRKISQRNNGVVVTIGSENEDDEINDCSLITATYHLDGELVGTIGVIGPTRMKYDEVTSVVSYLSENLNEAFRIAEGGEEENNDDR